MVLLEVFIRLAKDDRLQYYSLRGGREVWLHYSPYCNSRVNLQYPVSKDDDGRLWPMADRENDAAFVMCMKLVETGIYYGIEFSSTNHQAYEALMDAFQIENVLSAGSYEVLRLGEGVVGLESLSELKDGLNQAMDLFCSCGEKLLLQLSDQ